MSNFIYEYIRIFVSVEIFSDVTLWVGNSGESGSIGESGASEIYDDSGDSGNLVILVIPKDVGFFDMNIFGYSFVLKF